MRQSEQPQTVTVVASPPPELATPNDNPFITAALETLANKQASGNRVVRACSVRDIDLQLSEIFQPPFRGTVRLQIIGHNLSGMLALGASWIPEEEIQRRAFKYPFYVVDTNPAALGLLAKHAGKISELMLVSCNVGSASSFGYPINGRTLTYTLAELLRCQVRGADDVVDPDEFDARGWYEPHITRRRPKGWRWLEAAPPVWAAPGVDPVPGAQTKVPTLFEIRSITRSSLPTAEVTPQIPFNPAIAITCDRASIDKPQSALPELAVETDRGPAYFVCGGRFLYWQGSYFAVQPSAQLAAKLAASLSTPRAAQPPAPPAEPPPAARRSSTTEPAPVSAPEHGEPSVLSAAG